MNTCEQSVIAEYAESFKEYKEKVEAGTITASEIETARTEAYLYYSYLEDNGIAYGEAAKDVSQDTGFFGSYANELLTN